MSPLQRPSPDRQVMLYSSSHLQGMERPVRSFKSFIRATPPRTSPEKPLPPVPPPLQRTTSSSSITTVQTRSTGLSLWEAPSNWDNDEGSHGQSTPPFALRHYSLLIPEPPEDIAAMQKNPNLWQQGNGPFQQTSLDPIHERTAVTPDIPPRNPYRLSLSLSNPATTRKNSKDTLPSVSSRYSTGKPREELLAESFEAAPVSGPKIDLPSPLDLVSALSDMAMKEKALDSLGQGSSCDQGIIWGDQHQRSDSVQLEDDSQLDLQGNKLKTFRRGSALIDDSPVSPEDPDISAKMQALSFAQDYHNALADRSFDHHDQSGQDASLSTPPKDPCMTPRPLNWRKESGTSPPAEAAQHPQLPPTPLTGRYKKLRKMSSWVNHRLKADSQSSIHYRSTSEPEVLSHGQLSETEVDRHLKIDARLANIVQHGKDLVSRRILRRESEQRKPLVISLPLPQHSAQEPENTLVSAAPFELATPVCRLPGGLAIVRQSPLSTPRPQTASDLPPSPFSDLSWPDFPVSSPFRRNFSRRGSWQSAESQPQTASSSTFRRKFSVPLGSPSALRSFSYSKTSLTSPSPQEAPQTPPKIRRRSHNIGSPLTVLSFPYGVEQHNEDPIVDTTHRLRLFEKAKTARDAWKKHQKDLRNEKLKQSIVLVGPADARDVAGYIKCDGRVSGDSGIGEGQLPQEMVKEVN